MYLKDENMEKILQQKDILFAKIYRWYFAVTCHYPGSLLNLPVIEDFHLWSAQVPVQVLHRGMLLILITTMFCRNVDIFEALDWVFRPNSRKVTLKKTLGGPKVKNVDLFGQGGKCGPFADNWVPKPRTRMPKARRHSRGYGGNPPGNLWKLKAVREFWAYLGLVTIKDLNKKVYFFSFFSNNTWFLESVQQ